jgi:hypothetical protein
MDMKKKYSKLSMRVFQLQPRNCLLQGSVKEVYNSVGLEYGGGDSGSARTRENNLWDEEW